MKLSELQPLDFLVSYKKPDDLFGKLMDNIMLSYSKRKYSGGIYKKNHIKIIKENVNSPIGFEWTYPKSQCFNVEQWNIDQPYAHVLRYKGLVIPDPVKIHNCMMYHNNKKYDWLQLLGMWLNIKWVQLGEKYEVCSTGATEIFEELTGINLFPEMETWQVPPCAWMNHLDKFEVMN